VWKRLSDRAIAEFEAQEAVRRRRPYQPLAIALAVSVPFAALWAAGYRGGFLRTGAVMLQRSSPILSPGTIIPVLLCFAITFVFAYRKQRLTGRGLFGGPPSVICRACQQLQDKGLSERCSCGGEWDNVDHWEWVAEGPGPGATTEASRHDEPTSPQAGA
jgi:hypothetical protein